MDIIELADIKEIPLRDLFPNESSDFTPWLAENIDLLGNIIGMELIDAETEVLVGNYKLDILANESGTERKIAIENQFETTDHSHLGQLLTYMAGKNAEVIVWIAENFREEHITAINHLNEISNKNVAFFCIKPRLIQIGSSKPALEFVIITKPDEWEKSIQSDSGFTPTKVKYKEFWSSLIEKYSQIDPTFKVKKAQTDSWILFGAGKTGLGYSWFFRPGSFCIELYINTKNQERNDDIFNQFLNYKDEIEAKFRNVEWYKKENIKKRTIRFCRTINSNILELTEEEKEELINWAIDEMLKFKKVINPYIKEIK